MTGTNFVIIIPDIQMNMIGLEKDKLVEESYLQLSSKTSDVTSIAMNSDLSKLISSNKNCTQIKQSDTSERSELWSISKNIKIFLSVSHTVRKLLKKSHFNFSILAFFTNFCHLPGNTIWLQTSGFQKVAQMWLLWIFKHCELKCFLVDENCSL